MLLLEILIVGTAGLLTFLGIAIFRAHSLDRQWLDIPNERSSHDRPVPRGAGLVVVPVCLIGYVLTTQISGTHFSWGYLLGAILVALVSWIDDLYSISFVWRLMTHCLAALFILFSEGYWTTFSLGGGVSLAVGW